jgi:hypothetical protein
MEAIAELIESRWPDEEKLPAVWMTIGHQYESRNQPLKAALAYSRVNEDAEQFADARLVAGECYWVAARRTAIETGEPIDEALIDSARQRLTASLSDIEAEQLTEQPIRLRLWLAQMDLVQGKAKASLQWLSDPERSVSDSIGVEGVAQDGNQPLILVSEAVARQVFETIFAAKQHLGDQIGSKDTLERMAKVIGKSDVQAAPKLLGVVTSTIRRMQTKNRITESDVGQLSQLVQSLLASDSELTPANLMWIGESWSRIGKAAESEALSRQCASAASDLYRQAMDHADFASGSVQSARLRRIELLRESGDAATAMSLVSDVLSETPNALGLQLEAATSLQEMAIETNDVGQLRAAANGPGAGSPIWGWAKLVTTLHTLRYAPGATEQQKSDFVRAQYNLALCQTKISKLSGDEKLAASVKRMIRTNLATMDSANPWRAKFESLQQEIESN